MAVLVRHRVSGMTPEQYDHSAPALIEKLKTQPGFLYHVAFVDEGDRFTVSEIWGEQGETRPLVQRERRGRYSLKSSSNSLTFTPSSRPRESMTR